MLIDQRNTSESDQAFVLQRMVKFLESRRSKGRQPDRMAIYTFGYDGSLGVPQELTDDSELLLRAVKLLKPHDPAFRTGDRDETNAEIARLELQNRVIDSNAVLQAVARHLASVPGRKNLIWITVGFPAVSMEGSTLVANFNPRMEAAARALTNANFAFYGVDALGLRGSLSGITGIPDAASAPPYASGQFVKLCAPGNGRCPAEVALAPRIGELAILVWK